MYKKDFKSWHTKKEQLDNIPQPPFFHEREIWYCHLGVNVGAEQDGSGKDFLRPIIIIRIFNNEIFWSVPLTRTTKKSKYYFSFKAENSQEVSSAILSQIRLTDARRLSYKIGNIEDKDFEGLKIKLKTLLP